MVTATIILRTINILLAATCCIAFAYYCVEFIKEITKRDSK